MAGVVPVGFFDVCAVDGAPSAVVVARARVVRN